MNNSKQGDSFEPIHSGSFPPNQPGSFPSAQTGYFQPSQNGSFQPNQTEFSQSNQTGFSQPNQTGSIQQNDDKPHVHSAQPIKTAKDPYSASPPLYPCDAAAADNYTDGAETNASGLYFNESSIRKAFIRKVFSIVSVQLAITLALTSLCVFESNTKNFVQNHVELIIVAFVIKFIVLIALICFKDMRRKSPHNYILLFMFTISKAFIVAVVASFYDAFAVVIAFGFATVVCVGLCFYAMQTKRDFTVMGGGLFVFLLIFILFVIMCSFLYSRVLELLIGAFGALLFSFYFVYDIQLMMGGKHRYQISSEEYVFAALNLFIDIIQIFVYILRIVGMSR